MNREVKKGQKWIHYKHPDREYAIMGIAQDSDTLKEMVIYKALYKDEFPYGQLWVRLREEFLSKVMNKEGKEIERFTRIK